VAAQSSTLALMKKVPSRHVWSSSNLAEDSNTESPPVNVSMWPGGLYERNHIPEERSIDVFHDADMMPAERYLPHGTTAPHTQGLSGTSSLAGSMSTTELSHVRQHRTHTAGPMPESAEQSGYCSPPRVSGTGGLQYWDNGVAQAGGAVRGGGGPAGGGGAESGLRGEGYIAGGLAGPGMLQPPTQWPQQPPPPKVRLHLATMSQLSIVVSE
jgi:hypothetical protein